MLVRQAMKNLVLAICLASNSASGALQNRIFEGPSVSDGASLAVRAEGTQKGVVIVFLSAVCPCSNSHIGELRALHGAFPQFAFLGIHANTDESEVDTREYFAQVNLPFPVLRDRGLKFANELKASRTPHAFVLSPEGKILYRGGVSDSQHFSSETERKYLREALGDIVASRAVVTAETRALGCGIDRRGGHVW